MRSLEETAEGRVPHWSAAFPVDLLLSLRSRGYTFHMRDTWLVFFGIIIALVLGAYLYFGNSGGFGPDGLTQGRDSGSFTILQEGANSGQIDTRTNYRIETADELAELWALIYGTNAPPMPNVDFSKYEVIAVFDGSHSTGGYRVEVTQVRDADGKRTVHIRHAAPGSRCVTSPAITSPFQVVRVLKTVLPIVREEETVTTDC